MPKLDIKAVYEELKQGLVWPVYWVHGAERLRARELIRRIEEAVQGAEAGGMSQGVIRLEGQEASASTVLEHANSLLLGGGKPLIIVRDAQQLDELEELSTQLGPRVPLAECPSVVVLWAKDLDQRRKFSKELLEKAAVIETGEVPEREREAWVRFMAKRKAGLALLDEHVAQLASADPWSLEMIENELEKADLMGATSFETGSREPLSAARAQAQFTEAFFLKNETQALELASHFADDPGESFPLLGLMTWNLRQLFLQKRGQFAAGRGGFVQDRFQRWAGKWQESELVRAQHEALELDFALKQTAQEPLGAWAVFIQKSLNN